MFLSIFKSREDRFYEKVVNKVKGYILSVIPKEELISLYLAGRILTRDRSPTSDIDVFGIVTDSFNVRLEGVINDFFKKNPEFTGNKECRFRAIFLSDLEGRTVGKSTIISSVRDVKLFLKLFRHSNYRLLYGKRINFSTFKIKDLEDVEELKLDLELLKKNIEFFKRNNYREEKPYHTIPNTVKLVLHIARLEGAITGRCKYEPYFYKLKRVFKRDKNHIFHTALKIRMEGKELPVEEKKEFIMKVEEYIKDIEELIK